MTIPGHRPRAAAATATTANALYPSVTPAADVASTERPADDGQFDSLRDPMALFSIVAVVPSAMVMALAGVALLAHAVTTVLLVTAALVASSSATPDPFATRRLT
jgi:predicted methyltransferase